MGQTAITVTEFDLALTLESGQFFRYEVNNEEYLLKTQQKAIRVRQTGDNLTFNGTDARFITQLFALDGTYLQQLAELRKDPVLLPIIDKYPGLRLMRQDLHEAIIGFICSSMSNIPKIRMNLELIAKSCGEEVNGHHFLPRPATALSVDAIRNAKTGYRAPYIVQTNALLTEELLQKISSGTYEQSHALLCTLPGVGPKVADCICLFALGHGEAFPVDVHIMRAMRTLFPRSRLTNEKKAKAFAQKRWGKNAGLAQQFIFQAARDGRVI